MPCQRASCSLSTQKQTRYAHFEFFPVMTQIHMSDLARHYFHCAILNRYDVCP